jgi:hypothetical protein
MEQWGRLAKGSGAALVPRLLTAFAAAAGVVSLYFLVPELQVLELAMLLVAVGLLIAGYTQNVVRGIVALTTFHIATAMAATFCTSLAPYVGGMVRAFSSLDRIRDAEGATMRVAVATRSDLMTAFLLIVGVTWGVLEFIERANFPDTRLPKLGFLDRLGGLILHLVLGVLVASVLFNTIGYGPAARREHNSSVLRPWFNQVLDVHYEIQSYWLPRPLPLICVYDLD